MTTTGDSKTQSVAPRGNEKTTKERRSGESKESFLWEHGEPGRTTLFPIRYDDIWQFRKVIERLHWVVEDVDTSRDREDWKSRMTDDERHPVKYSLGLFAVFDNLVLKNLSRLSEEVDCLEAQAFYSGQEDQESIHMEAYMLQIEAVARDEDEKAFMLNSIQTMPGVALLVKWAKHWMDRSLPFGECFVAFAVIEGVVFRGFFSILQWLRERNLLPGVTDFNAFIARDEGIHCLCACLILRKYMRNRPARSRVHAIIKSAIKAVSTMIDEALPKRLNGINADLVRQYVRFEADSVCAQMGYDIVYGVANPLKFMDKLTMNAVNKYNFFERRPNQYQGSSEGAAVWKVDRSPIRV
jgi:ribonucleotide reductase beta subunit family protein with ferritin-like domain